MKQVKFKLTHDHNHCDWEGETPFGRLVFCYEPMTDICPQAATSASLLMTVCSQQLSSQFIPVRLSRKTSTSLWRWQIPSLGMVDPTGQRSKYIFSFSETITDSVIRRLMGKGKTYQVPKTRTVWLNLIPE